MFEERENDLLRHSGDSRAVDDKIASGRVLHRPCEREIRYLSGNDKRNAQGDIAGLVMWLQPPSREHYRHLRLGLHKRELFLNAPRRVYGVFYSYRQDAFDP